MEADGGDVENQYYKAKGWFEASSDAPKSEY